MSPGMVLGDIVQLLSIVVAQPSKALIPLKTAVPFWNRLAKVLLSLVKFMARLSLMVSILLSCSDEFCVSYCIVHV